jgi:hypothetical protein
MMKKIAQLTILTMALGLLAACSSPAPAASAPAPTNTSAPASTVAPTETSTAELASDNPLVGEWEGVDADLGPITIEFKSDFRYEVSTEGGPTFELTYELVDDDTYLLIDPSGDTQPSTVDFVRSGDTLTLTEGGRTLELTLHD